MPRYVPPTAPTPTNILSSVPISHNHAHTLLSQYLVTTTSSQPWSHSHDAGTTSSLKKIELSLRGIHGHDANLHLSYSADGGIGGGAEDVDMRSKVDTDEGGEIERQRVYETPKDVDGEEVGSDDGLAELQNVKRVEEGEMDYVKDVEVESVQAEAEGKVIDKEERKRLKKLRHKEDKRKKEAERVAENA